MSDNDARFCDAKSVLSPEGCFGAPNHTGPHRGWSSDATGAERVYWDDAPTEFTEAELKVILTLLAPVSQFFPELQAKVEKAIG